MLLSAESSSKQRIKLIIKGIVQGVGFRPFIYQLATKYDLGGFVSNNGSGVVVEVEGNKKECELFLRELNLHTPPLSRIDTLEKEQLTVENASKFEIIESSSSSVSTLLSPDISVCHECLAEMRDKNNRRYAYPFINCTNCGPRYTIINNLPYDRKNTSMKSFAMCQECQEEYTNPNDRRYHAQPISCYKCGPKLKYLSLFGNQELDEKKAMEKICSLIKEGEVVAIKGLGGFHIVCDATNSNAVSSLRKNKHRPTKPLAVMFQNLAAIKKVAVIKKEEETLILSKERPIVIVEKKENSTLSELIAPNIDRIGVFLPYTPLHELLLNKLDVPIVATSANLSGEPIILDESEIFKKLPFVVSHLLTYNREIVNACDDSVVQATHNDYITLRMARGYAPYSLHLEKKSFKKVLALGANQKVTIALAFDGNVVISPHIGDLGSIESNGYFLKALNTLKRVYNFEPEVIVCDKHPGYETTLFAKEYVSKHQNVALIELQHHYAHALSCMAEYNLNEDVLAFCFDGTGYGDDSTLWGGEVLLASPQKYKRLYNFKKIPLLGGEKAVKEPRRVALSLLFNSFSLEEVLQMESINGKLFTESEIKTLYQMYKRNINAPLSSSVGRVFDGVFALSGYTQNISYEGESGLILESISSKSKTKATYSYEINDGVIDYTPMIEEILREGNKSDIAKKFILTISKIVIDISSQYPDLPVVLSGGVFQNKTLVSEITKLFCKIDRKYYIQHKTPLNDGGISLGQIYFALNKKDI